jgi:hypothetical protein
VSLQYELKIGQLISCGSGGAGYQTSWGTARMVLKLVKDAVGSEGEQAKL